MYTENCLLPINFDIGYTILNNYVVLNCTSQRTQWCRGRRVTDGNEIYICSVLLINMNSIIHEIQCIAAHNAAIVGLCYEQYSYNCHISAPTSVIFASVGNSRNTLQKRCIHGYKCYRRCGESIIPNNIKKRECMAWWKAILGHILNGMPLVCIV